MHHTAQREFRTKPLIGWTVVDVCDWLDSLFMSEYKAAFIDHDVDGLKLASMTKKELEVLGVIRVGHTMNIEKSLKRYLSPNWKKTKNVKLEKQSNEMQHLSLVPSWNYAYLICVYFDWN